jgi:hypothetical protein
MRACALLLVLASAAAFAPAARTARSTVSMIQRGPKKAAAPAAKVRARSLENAREGRSARASRRAPHARGVERAARSFGPDPPLVHARALSLPRARAQPAAKGGRFALKKAAAPAPAPAPASFQGPSWVDFAFGGLPATKLTPTAAVTKGWEGLGNDEWRIKFARRHGFLLKEDEDVYDDNLTMKERMNISQGKFISINGAARNNLAAIDPELVYKR